MKPFELGLLRALLNEGDLLSSGDCCQLVNVALVFVTMIVVFTVYLLCVGSASRSLHAF